VQKDRRRKLTPEEHKQIIRRRKAGEAAMVLALEFGVSKKTVDDMFQSSLTPGVRLSRRQLNHYLKLLGIEPPNVQRIVDQKAKKPPAKPAKSAKAPVRLDKKAWVQIRKRHAAGESIAALAAAFGISRQAVSSGLQRAKQRPPLVCMTLEHLEWLKQQLMPKGRRKKNGWTHQEVSRLLTAHFGQRISLRTFRSQLEWLGVRSAQTEKTAERRQAMREEKRRLHEQNEPLVLAAIESGKIPLIVRGRRKK